MDFTQQSESDLEYLILLALRRASTGGGGTGGGTTEHVVAMPFSFASPISQVLGTAATGNLFNRSVALVTIPFDAPGARVRLGTSANLSLLLDYGLGSVGQYENDELAVITTPDLIILTVDSLGSVVGSGTILYKVTP